MTAITLTKNETIVYNIIAQETSLDDIAFIAELKMAAVYGIVSSLAKKGAAVKTESGEYVRAEGVNVELYTEKEVAPVAVQAPAEQVETADETAEEPVEPAKATEPPTKKDDHNGIDLAKFTKAGKPRVISNAARMREQIAMVKGKMDDTEAEKLLMQWAMETLGHTKQLAKSYVKTNWHRVKV